MNLAIDKYGNVNYPCINITSLEGAPEYVGGYFDCSGRNITSLKGAPKYVERFFDCSHTQITSLKGTTEYVGRFFDCSYTNITSLDGAPKRCKTLICYGTKITKEQAINYLQHSNCKAVSADFGTIYKKEVIKKLAVE